MNKKLFISVAIATGLLLTACVKKEAPKEEEQQQVEVPASESAPVELVEAPEAPLIEESDAESVEDVAAETEQPVTPAAPPRPAAQPVEPAAAPAAPKVEDKPAETYVPTAKTNTGSAQSEDDAIADAIAAAMPALEN